MPIWDLIWLAEGRGRRCPPYLLCQGLCSWQRRLDQGGFFFFGKVINEEACHNLWRLSGDMITWCSQPLRNCSKLWIELSNLTFGIAALFFTSIWFEPNSVLSNQTENLEVEDVERERDAAVCFKKVKGRSFKFSASDRAEALSSAEPGPVDPTLTYSNGWKWNGPVHLSQPCVETSVSALTFVTEQKVGDGHCCPG